MGIVAIIAFIGVAAGYAGLRLLRPKAGDEARWLYRSPMTWARYSLAAVLFLLCAVVAGFVVAADVAFVRYLVE